MKKSSFIEKYWACILTVICIGVMAVVFNIKGLVSFMLGYVLGTIILKYFERG